MFFNPSLHYNRHSPSQQGSAINPQIKFGSLTPQYSFTPFSIFNSQVNRSLSAGFECLAELPSSLSPGILFECGAALYGCGIFLRQQSNGTYILRLRGFDGGVSGDNLTNTAAASIDLPIDSSFSVGLHYFAALFDNTKKSITFFIDGISKGQNFSSYNSNYAGGDNCGYGILGSGVCAGEPSTNWPGKLHSPLNYYNSSDIFKV